MLLDSMPRDEDSHEEPFINMKVVWKSKADVFNQQQYQGVYVETSERATWCGPGRIIGSTKNNVIVEMDGGEFLLPRGLEFMRVL